MTRPTSLTILGQTFLVNTWRDVAYNTALTLSELVDDFGTKIAEYQRAGAVFTANQHIENQITVEAPSAARDCAQHRRA